MEIIFSGCIKICADFVMDGTTPTGGGGGGGGGGDVGVPTGLAAISAKHYSITLSWNAVAAATGYELRARENTSTVWTTFAGASTNAIAQKLKQGTLYQFQVRATDGVSFSPWSPTVVAASVLRASDDSDNLYFGTVYYVSTSGNDASVGTSPASAWQTLSKVNSTLAAAGGPITILFNRGNVWTGSIAVPSITGTSAGNRVKFGSYGSGLRPVIRGSENVSTSLTWSVSADPNIWYCDISMPGVGMLIVDDAISYPCRSAQQVIDSGTATSITDTAFLTGVSYVGAQCTHKGSKYSAETQTIETHNTVSGTITWSETNNPNDGQTDYGYYIYNHPSLMSSVGDWWFDIPNQRLYFYTGGGAPTQEIMAPQYEYGFVVNCPYVSISDIDMMYYHEGAVYCDQDGLSVSFSKMMFNYNSCIFMSGTLDFLDVISCEMAYSSGGGLYGLNTSSAVVRYNHVHHIGDIIWGRATGIEGGGEAANNNFFTGIGFKPSRNNLIEYNYVHHIGYNGIRSDGENHIIRKNYVHDCLLQFGDGGGIYMYDVPSSSIPTQNNLIELNIVHDSIGSLDGVDPSEVKKLSAGIYLDERTSNTTVRNNVVYDITSDCIKMNYITRNNTIQGNIVYNGKESLLHLSNRSNIANQSTGHIVRDNIFVSLDPTVRPIYYLNFLDEVVNGQWDPCTFINNKYVYPYLNFVIFKKQQGPGPDEDLTFAQFVTDHGETGSTPIAPNSEVFVSEAAAKADYPVFSNPRTDLDNEYSFSGSFTDIDLAPAVSPVVLPGYTGAVLLKT